MGVAGRCSSRFSSLRVGVATVGGLGRRCFVERRLGVVGASEGRLGRVVRAVARPVAGLATAMAVSFGGGSGQAGVLEYEVHDFGTGYGGGVGRLS